MKTGLVMEGGALRTIFSCGVCDALLDADLPMPDYFVGVSGGIAYGVSYLAKQKRRNLKLLTSYANDPRYMGWRNLANPKNKSYFGLKFAYETIPTQLLPFDYDAFDAYPGTVEAVVTNVNTGLAEYHEVNRRQVPNQTLIASCSIPLMFPIAELDGQPYLDGGCADPIPWKRALDVGCDRVLVLLTQPRNYSKQIDSTLTLIEQSFRKYPAFLETMRHRVERYNASREELFAREAAGDLLVIAPEDTFGCSRTERDTEVLRALWQSGYFAGRKAADSIRTLWTE
jgi:predicted patatin/cPLA2 family phospholipase